MKGKCEIKHWGNESKQILGEAGSIKQRELQGSWPEEDLGEEYKDALPIHETLPEQKSEITPQKWQMAFPGLWHSICTRVNQEVLIRSSTCQMVLLWCSWRVPPMAKGHFLGTVKAEALLRVVALFHLHLDRGSSHSMGLPGRRNGLCP